MNELISGDRTNQLIQIIVEDLLEKKSVSGCNRDLLFNSTSTAVFDFLKEWEEMDKAVKQKIESLKRKVLFGTSEWEVLYKQYFEEYLSKVSIYISL